MEYDAQQKINLFDSAGPSKVYELIIKKAAVDRAFRERMISISFFTALQELGLTPPSELMTLLTASEPEHIEKVIDGTSVEPELKAVLIEANDAPGIEKAKIAFADIMIAKGEVNTDGPMPVVPSPDPMPVTGSRPGGPFGPRKSGGLVGWLRRLFGGK